MTTVHSETFYIEFAHPTWFKVGEILASDRGEVKVLKVYKMNWYRKLLKFLGFKTRENQIKVIHYITKH